MIASDCNDIRMGQVTSMWDCNDKDGNINKVSD